MSFRKNQYLKISIAVLCVLVIAMAGPVVGQSVYLAANHHSQQFDAWNINTTGPDTICNNILVYATTDDPNKPYTHTSFMDLGDVLCDWNVTVADRVTMPLINADILCNYDQFWLMSSDLSFIEHFSPQEVDDILAFRESGGGLLIAADDEYVHNYQDDANQISIPLGVEFSGTVSHGNHDCFVPVTTDHSVVTQVDELYGTTNEGGMIVQTPNTIEATAGSDPIVVVKDDGLGRVVFDASFVRFMNSAVHVCDDSIYVNNVANWLQNCGTSRVHLDIKPGSCPNPLNCKNRQYAEFQESYSNDQSSSAKASPDGPVYRKAVLPAAVLGTVDFDVADIDPTTIMLDSVPVIRWNYEDVSTPMREDAEECACNTDGPDGFTDLTLKFDKAAIVAAIGEVAVGDTVVLTLTGELLDGTPIIGSDCMIIVGYRDDGENSFINTTGKNNIIPNVFALNQNHPNPFNPTTEISFSLPKACNVELVVYNITGQKVTALLDAPFETGNHSVLWDGSNAASGVYFYQIKAGEFTETKKMILLK